MEKFTSKWESPGSELEEIVKALIADEVRDCGEFYVRRSVENPEKYLIAGSANGKNWSYYFVWLDRSQVAGPLSEDYGKPY